MLQHEPLLSANTDDTHHPYICSSSHLTPCAAPPPPPPRLPYRDMVSEFERVSMAMSEPDADLDALTNKMSRLQVC